MIKSETREIGQSPTHIQPKKPKSKQVLMDLTLISANYTTIATPLINQAKKVPRNAMCVCWGQTTADCSNLALIMVTNT